MKRMVLRIGGMSCSACSGGLEKYLNKQAGIHMANVNLVMASASVEYDEDIARYVKESGFECIGEYSKTEDKGTSSSKKQFIIYTSLAILLLYAAMGHMMGLPVPPILNMHTHPLWLYSISFLLAFPFLIYGYDIIKSGIKNLKNIPGRFNKYFLDLNRLVVVDFAHTPDGFEKVLSEVKNFRSGEIIVVFGCVGYSDKLKRIHMAEVASKYCDQIVLTTDNPNYVKFSDICVDVLKGVSVKVSAIENRQEAIEFAFANLNANDTLLILGKGCETHNLICGVKVPHNDLRVVENCIQKFYGVKKGECVDSSIV